MLDGQSERPFMACMGVIYMTVCRHFIDKHSSDGSVQCRLKYHQTQDRGCSPIGGSSGDLGFLEQIPEPGVYVCSSARIASTS